MFGTAKKINGACFRLLRHRGHLCLPVVAGHELAERNRALLTDLRRRYLGCHRWLSRVEVSARHGEIIERERSGQ